MGDLERCFELDIRENIQFSNSIRLVPASPSSASTSGVNLAIELDSPSDDSSYVPAPAPVPRVPPVPCSWFTGLKPQDSAISLDLDSEPSDSEEGPLSAALDICSTPHRPREVEETASPASSGGSSPGDSVIGDTLAAALDAACSPQRRREGTQAASPASSSGGSLGNTLGAALDGACSPQRRREEEQAASPANSSGGSLADALAVACSPFPATQCSTFPATLCSPLPETHLTPFPETHVYCLDEDNTINKKKQNKTQTQKTNNHKMRTRSQAPQRILRKISPTHLMLRVLRCQQGSASSATPTAKISETATATRQPHSSIPCCH